MIDCSRFYKLLDLITPVCVCVCVCVSVFDLPCDASYVIGLGVRMCTCVCVMIDTARPAISESRVIWKARNNDKEAASSRGGGSEASPVGGPASGGPASGGPASGGPASGGQGTEASPAEIILRKDGIIARPKRKSKIDGNRVYFSMY